MTVNKIYMKSDKIIMLHKPMYFYRQRPQSIVRSNITLQKCEDALFSIKERLFDVILSPNVLDLELQKRYTFRRLEWIKECLEELQETNSIAYKEVTRLLSYQE